MTKENNANSLNLSKESVERYLASLYNGKINVISFRCLGGKSKSLHDLKGFGYGFPYLIKFTVDNKVKRAVLETMRPGSFGHDNFSDRAQVLLWQHSAFNKLPRHVRSVDV